MNSEFPKEEFEKTKKRLALRRVADIAYDILQHGESFENRDKLKNLLPILGYKVED